MWKNRAGRTSRLVIVGVLVWIVTMPVAMADVFRWDNGLLIPDTEGITAGPGVGLAYRQLQYADLRSIDLTDADFIGSNLSNSIFAGARLTNARLSASTLAGANLTGAIVTGANFDYTTSRGFTKDQLYSTASYH
jgi:hypothetical protein